MLRGGDMDLIQKGREERDNYALNILRGFYKCKEETQKQNLITFKEVSS